MKLLLAIFLLCVPTTAWTETITTGKIRVTDGDTIRVGNDRYRLVGFDTPETFRAKSESERALGNKARQRVEELIAGGGLGLKEVDCACTKFTQRGADGKCYTYGRKCGLLTINGENIGKTLITEGLAREFICTPTQCPEQLPW